MKNNNYTALWLLLSLALIIISIVAFMDDIQIGDWTLKRAPMADVLLKNETANVIYTNDSLLDSLKATEEKEVMGPDSMPQSIFIFGDSMTYNLALRLSEYSQANGHAFNSVNWDSSNTKIWADHDTLQYFINKFKPTLIFISLGSNELYFKNPESRAPYVKKILEVIDTIPYVWIGPPNWKKDTGMNDMLERLCKPKSFFRSEGMEFQRRADHIHPTAKSSALWMDSIARWIPQSSHPIVLNTPPDSLKKTKPNIVFLKARNK